MTMVSIMMMRRMTNGMFRRNPTQSGSLLAQNFGFPTLRLDIIIIITTTIIIIIIIIMIVIVDLTMMMMTSRKVEQCRLRSTSSQLPNPSSTFSPGSIHTVLARW